MSATILSLPAAACGPASERAGRSSGLALRVALSCLLLSTTVLQRFGINFGSYSLNVAVVAMYACLGVAALQGALQLSQLRLLLYAACLTVASASLLVNQSFAQTDRSSVSSLL
ncbi:MAG: hypothetical protein RL033_5381, partial [Pseudomonadota bacterium]